MLEILIPELLIILRWVINSLLLPLLNALLNLLGLLIIERPEPPLIISRPLQELPEGIPGILFLLRLPPR